LCARLGYTKKLFFKHIVSTENQSFFITTNMARKTHLSYGIFLLTQKCHKKEDENKSV